MTETVLSPSITLLDTAIQARSSAGFNGQSYNYIYSDLVTSTSGATSPSIYRLIRLPSNISVKHVFIWLDEAVTTFHGTLGWYYSDNVQDGTSQQNVAASISTTAHMASFDISQITSPLDMTNQSGNFPGAARQQFLWQAIGLGYDPGGYFDLVFTTDQTNSGAATLNAEVVFT